MNIDLRATLVVSEAAVTYSKKGVKLPIGDNALRLHLSCFDRSEEEQLNPNKSDSRFDINCYNVQPGELECIPIEIEKQKYYLDLTECSKRLHLSKKKIRAYIEQNDFFSFIKDNTNKLKRLISVVNHYQRLMRFYNQQLNNTYLFSKKGVEIPLLTRRELMKIVHIVEKELEKHERPIFFKMRLTKKQREKVGLNYISKLSILSCDKDDCIIINQSSKTKVLPEASNSIFKVHNISIANFSILKKSVFYGGEDITLREGAAISFFNIKNEVEILNKLASKKVLRGIQRPPYFTIEDFKQSPFSSEFIPRIYYYGHYYSEQDLFECSGRLNIEERVNLLAPSFNQVITGLYLLHKNGFFHTDIKPENIFVEKSTRGKYHLAIGDMGGGRRTTKPNKLFRIEMHTNAYTPFCPTREYTKSEMQAVDVFQLGSTLVTALVDRTPYSSSLNSIEYPNPEIPFDDSVLNQYCSKEAVDLLRDMCLLDETLRPTIAIVRQRVKAFGFSWNKKDAALVHTDST